MNEHYERFYSHNLGRDIEMLSFGHAGYPVVLFPTSMARFYENKEMGLIESARWFIENGLVRIYCPDSIDLQSWYDKGAHPGTRAYNHVLYDKFLYEELLPSIQYRTWYEKVAVAGCSFGGYHAANFGFKHPDKTSHIISMSGAFDIRPQVDGFYNQDVYFNNPMDYLPNDNNSGLWNMKIILGTSEWDICYGSNVQLSGILNSKGIPHWLDVRGWALHDWPIWREMFPHYLSLL